MKFRYIIVEEDGTVRGTNDQSRAEEYSFVAGNVIVDVQENTVPETGEEITEAPALEEEYAEEEDEDESQGDD